MKAKQNTLAPKLQYVPPSEQREWSVWYDITTRFGANDREVAYFNNQKSADRFAKTKENVNIDVLDGNGMIVDSY